MKNNLGTKGISTLVASVLLVAFTVAAFGIIVTWGTDFISSTTSDVSQQTDEDIDCIYAGISVSNLRYCNHYLSGAVENTEMVSLRNITLTVVFTNGTNERLKLNDTSGNFMQLDPGNLDSFNETIGGSNYDIIRISTSTCPDVSDSADSSDVTAC